MALAGAAKHSTCKSVAVTTNDVSHVLNDANLANYGWTEYVFGTSSKRAKFNCGTKVLKLSRVVNVQDTIKVTDESIKVSFIRDFSSHLVSKSYDNLDFIM